MAAAERGQPSGEAQQVGKVGHCGGNTRWHAPPCLQQTVGLPLLHGHSGRTSWPSGSARITTCISNRHAKQRHHA